MNLRFLVTTIFLFTMASSAPFTTREIISTAERHIIRHTHKINCLNCFCGGEAIKRARHACSKDRDLILCPQAIPVRVCYRCACFPRIPVSPSPPVMTSHSGDDHKDDDIRKQEESRDNKQDDQKQSDSHKHDEDQKHGDYEEDHEHDDMMTPTPDEMDMPSPAPLMSKPPSTPTKKPNLSHTPKSHSSQKTCSTFSRGGGGGNTMFDVNLSQNHGIFKVTWQMNRIPDRVEIFYEEKKIFSTYVPVSGHGSAYVEYSGSSHIITVWVTAQTTGTGWFMSIGCPTSD